MIYIKGKSHYEISFTPMFRTQESRSVSRNVDRPLNSPQITTHSGAKNASSCSSFDAARSSGVC